MLPETTAVLYPHETAATDESELNTSQSTDSSHPPEEYSRPNTSEGQLDGPTSGMIETSVNPPVVQSTLALPINTPRPVTQSKNSIYYHSKLSAIYPYFPPEHIFEM